MSGSSFRHFFSGINYLRQLGLVLTGRLVADVFLADDYGCGDGVHDNAVVCGFPIVVVVPHLVHLVVVSHLNRQLVAVASYSSYFPQTSWVFLFQPLVAQLCEVIAVSFQSLHGLQVVLVVEQVDE